MAPRKKKEGEIYLAKEKRKKKMKLKKLHNPKEECLPPLKRPRTTGGREQLGGSRLP